MPNCSQQTVQRRLQEDNIQKWLAKGRPLLTDAVAAKRLAFAIEHRHWTFKDWKMVLFSNECTIEKGSGGAQTWVFRRPDEK